MDEFAKTIHFIINHEINLVLDNISIDFNIHREDLNKYCNEILDLNEDNVIEIPTISDYENLEKSDIPIVLNNDTLNEITQTNESNINNINNIKCKQITRRGKQCDYNAKPNSEYCGRHLK